MNGSSVLEVLRGFCAVLEGVDGRCATCVADAVEHSNEVLTSLGIQGMWSCAAMTTPLTMWFSSRN